MADSTAQLDPVARANDLYDVQALLEGARAICEDLPQDNRADRLERLLTMAIDRLASAADLLTTPDAPARCHLHHRSGALMTKTPTRCVRDDDVAVEYMMLEAAIEAEAITCRLLQERDRLQHDETDAADSLYMMRTGLLRIRELAGVIIIANNDGDWPLDELERTVFGRSKPMDD